MSFTHVGLEGLAFLSLRSLLVLTLFPNPLFQESLSVKERDWTESFLTLFCRVPSALREGIGRIFKVGIKVYLFVFSDRL